MACCPDPNGGEFKDQRPFGSLANTQPVPFPIGQLRCDVGHRADRLQGGAQRDTTTTAVLRNARRWVRGPHSGVDRALDDIRLLQCFEFVEEIAIAPVPLVCCDPVQRHRTQNRRAMNQVRRDLGFGLKADIFGDMHLSSSILASLRCLAPRFGQVQLMIQQHRTTRGDADQKDPDLAVVLFAQTAVVLPGHTDALIAFLGKTTFVDDAYDSNSAVGYSWHQFIDEDALNLGLHVLIVPRHNVVDFCIAET